jgi:hypothetical protein
LQNQGTFGVVGLALARKGIAGAYALGTGTVRKIWVFRLLNLPPPSRETPIHKTREMCDHPAQAVPAEKRKHDSSARIVTKKISQERGDVDFALPGQSVMRRETRNQKFAAWDATKQKRVISRVRQLGKKFGLKGFSLAVKKLDYDEVVSGILEYADRYHYTWAIRSMIDLLDKWGLQSNATLPCEYIYDWMDPKTQREAKAEIDTVMAQAEEEACEAGMAGRYTNYSFRRRQDIPALQSTDALAWTCYRFALFAHLKTPLTKIAKESFDDYNKHRSGKWLYAAGVTRENLKKWVEAEIKDGRSLERFNAWNKKASGKI